MCQHSKHMKTASDMADKNIPNNFTEGGPFGAIVVNEDGVVVGRGKNNVLVNNDPTAHAEVTAIRDACKNLGTHDLSGCTVYTSCYPCPMCLSSIMWANIKEVYYGNTREDAADIGFRDDFIYNTIHSIIENGEESVTETVKLVAEGRDLTLPTFKKFHMQEDKTIY